MEINQSIIIKGPGRSSATKPRTKALVLVVLKFNTFYINTGFNVEIIKSKSINFIVWDVGGQATKLWKHYFDSVDGLLFVIDSTDQARIAKAKEELYKAGRDPQLQQVPYLLMFNKIDLVD